ncbi:MAG: pilus assembly protein [Chloroflexi bacterium]|nr:pilus assembly protein [Chloroflexota bacterium]
MRKPRDERGQALVEFALVSVMLFTIVVAIADFARLYFTYSSMNNAAREGTRYGVVNPNDVNGIRSRAEELLVVFGSEPDLEISFPDGSRVVGARLRVTVTSEFGLLVLPVPPFEITADSTMRIETVP